MNIYGKLKRLLHSKSDTGEEIMPHAAPSATCLNRLRNMSQLGFSPTCIFDCGASVGQWSLDIHKLYPQAQIVAIEPNPLVIATTRQNLSKILPLPVIEECAIGPCEGQTVLNIWDNEETNMSGSSLRQHVQGEPREKATVLMKTLDTISAENDLMPDLVKLDLQGFELEALKGANSILKLSEVFVVEFGCLPAYIDRTTPNELMEFMYQRGYCLYDIVDLIYRPYDDALAGGDFLFLRSDSVLRKYRGYR